MDSKQSMNEAATPCLKPNETSYTKEQKKSRCTRMEKILGLFLVVAIIAVIVLIVVVVTLKNDDDDKASSQVCLSRDCVTAAARIHDTVDQTVDPCEDFYKYSCGNWVSSNVIPEDRIQLDTFSVLRSQVEIVVKKLLETERKDSDPDFITKAKELYASCMNLDLIEEKGDQPLKDLLESWFGGWPLTKPTWTDETFDLENMAASVFQLGSKGLFRFGVITDAKNSSRRVLVLDQASFVMPGQKYYLVERNDTMLMAYQHLIFSIAKLMGVTNETKAMKDVEDMVNFEMDMAKISVQLEDRRDSNELYNNMTLRHLNATFGEEFDWSRFVKNLMGLDGVNVPDVTDDEVIINASPLYFHNLTRLLRRTPNRLKANYMIWTVVYEYLKQQSNDYRQLLNAYKKVIEGVASEPARHRTCSVLTTKHMGLAVGLLFIKDNFDEHDKSQALDMIHNLQQAFDELLDDLDWMDEETKELAKDKNRQINPKIGYPAYMTNITYMEIYYENYTFTDKDYFINIVGVHQEQFKDNLRRLREPVDKNKWSSSPSTINAFYNPLKNQISFPAGIFQPPFFSSSYPKSLNYGGIGVVIGHEITHGFDDQGRQYDKWGNLKDWWSQTAIEKFKGKVECIVEQYGNFTVEQVNMKMNGINTQGENIADNGGLKQSFRAYRNWVALQGKEEMSLPGLNLSHNQLFFINFAQIWCSIVRDAAAIHYIRTGYHSPGQFRVIGSVQNSPDFRDAFKCKAGSPMSREHQCVVW